MYFKMTRAAITVVGGVAALCLGSVPAALAAPAQNTDFVPCNADALYEAIGQAHYGETLNLAPGCTYYLPAGLPFIRTNLTIKGYYSTLTRTRDAGSFSLLTVGCGNDGGILASPDDGCQAKADLTVVNVDFTGGGGSGAFEGGAIDNAGGTLHVQGGIFSDNEARAGGAIYSRGHMTVNNATFTDNLGTYGGAILNASNASIGVSAFLLNQARTRSGDPDNSEGGAIYNAGHLDLVNSEFAYNSTGGYGGAIYTDDDLLAGHVSITGNAAGVDGGGIYNHNDDTVTLSSSAVFGNRPDNCYDVPAC